MNKNKNVHQLDAQVTELSTATKLTLGTRGRACEMVRTGWYHDDNDEMTPGSTEISKQVTELGSATALTLGAGCGNTEKTRSYSF